MSGIVLSVIRHAAELLTSRDIDMELLVNRAMDKHDQWRGARPALWNRYISLPLAK
jgi:hypothetical protein